MNKKKLVELVKKEASNLKKNATKREIARLDFDKLNPENLRYCIYGQMTNNCFNSRAHKLINQCAERMYIQSERKVEFSNCTLNGKPKLNLHNEERDSRFSPIECFITFDGNNQNGNNEAIIKYLKGETKTLTFKKF